jgi:hypothetical protein
VDILDTAAVTLTMLSPQTAAASAFHDLQALRTMVLILFI